MMFAADQDFLFFNKRRTQFHTAVWERPRAGKLTAYATYWGSRGVGIVPIVYEKQILFAKYRRFDKM